MPINAERRRKVMARSVKLGHCVCNPKLPCPCPYMIEQNVCTCAGEKPSRKEAAVPLTRHVRKAGCASKIGQADLLRIVGKLPKPTDPNVLVGVAAGDDAGVYQIEGGPRLVQTVDVFTPCVDDAYLFGRIAASNSVSDIYAMGATPLTALSIIGFPIDDLDESVMEQILLGGVATLMEAGCSLIGGHSINDEEIKCGFAVTGVLDEGEPISRNTARPGDALVLTKPLGTGMISFAAQIGRIAPECLTEAGEWMAALNKDAAALMVELGANACTDVTGFGLAGHLVEMARHSGVIAEIDLAELPVFPAVRLCLEGEILGGGIERNQEYSGAWVRFENPEAEMVAPILFDPQTSGGLLISLPEPKALTLVNQLRRGGNPAANIVGRIVEKRPDLPDGGVVVFGSRLDTVVGDSEKAILIEVPLNERSSKESVAAEACCATLPRFDDDDENQESKTEPESEAACCASPPGLESEDAMETEETYMEFMKKSSGPGVLDAKTKKIMAVALSIAERCDPCARIHVKSALDMGITKEEIEEAAWIGVSFGGCTAMMFYREIKEAMKL